MHVGHRAIIAETVRAATEIGGASLVGTLWPHPSTVLRPNAPVRLIDPLEDRLDVLAGLGTDSVCVIPFDREVASQSALDFLTRLKDRLGMAVLIVGPDARMGRDRHAGIPELEGIAAELDVELRIVDSMFVDGIAAGSGPVRRALERRDLQVVSRILARFPSHAGKVMSGDMRGRAIGFPTLNLVVPPERCLPGIGVYAGSVLIESDRGPVLHKAVMNLGTRPTFGEGGVLLEAHLLDFSGDLHGRRVRVYFERSLRPERRFDSVDELIEAIREDVDSARRLPPAEAELFLPWFAGASR